VTVDEQRRLRLFEAVREVLGEQEAATLMEYLPPVGWADVATKRDLDALTAELRGEMAEFRGEMAEFRSDIRAEMAEFRSGVRAEMAEFRSEIRIELHDALREQTTRLVTWMIPTWLSAVGIAVAASHLR
jgi:hypothetical protein